RLPRDYSFGNSGPQLLLALAEAPFDSVADERRYGGTGTRQKADEIAHHGRAKKHALDLIELLEGRQFGARVRNLVERFGGKARLQTRQNLTHAIGADHNHEKLDTVSENGQTERETVRPEHLTPP